MKNLQANLMKITLLALLSFATLNQVIVHYDKLCTCEQLLLESECGLYQKCSWKNSKCTTLPCTEITTKVGCKQNSDCAWNNNQCSKFDSCPKYNATTQTECSDLNHQCFFNSTSHECRAPQAPITTPCSINPSIACYIGKEGVCALSGQTSCKEMTSCSEGDSDVMRCLLAYPACQWDTNNCTSVRTCKDAAPNNCLYAKKDINGNEYYLCDETDCSDFNVTKQTNNTCFQDSLAYYHWVNDTCVSCESSSPGPSPNPNDEKILVLSILAIISIVY